MDPSRQADQPAELRQYLTILRSRKWTVVAVAAFVLGAALLFSYRQTPLYTSEARVLVKPLPSNPNDPFLLPPNLETESQLVASEPVAELVQEDLDVSRPPDELLDDLAVESVVESEVLVVGYMSEDPALARDAANSFATNYIEYRKQQALASLRAAEQSIRQRAANVQNQLSEITVEIERARREGDGDLKDTLDTQRSTLIARLGVLQQRLDDLQPDRSISQGGGEVIEPAGLSTTPSSPDHTKNGVLALTVGVLLGIGLAFLRERLDDRFRERLEVARAVGAPILATVPRFRPSRRRGARYELILATDPKGGASEAYRSLRTGVQFLAEERGIKSLLITSPSAGEGKTVTVANLGAAFARAGDSVVVASADLRRPTLERYFGVNNSEQGLSTWLLGEAHDLDSVLLETEIANVRLLPSGPIPHNPAELLASPRLPELIEQLTQAGDMVLFDSPPVLPVADATILASRVGATLVVVDASATRRSPATHAREALDRVAAQVIGCVLNAFDPTAAGYAYYDNYYYPGYYGQIGDEETSVEGSPALVRGPNGRRTRSRFSLRR